MRLPRDSDAKGHAVIAHVLDGSSTWHVEHGDSRDVLRAMPDACIDAIVCDPPYELGFMGKAWDASGIAYCVDLWREVLRVLKPGGHLLAFGGTRTYHRMACAIEDAGFEIRDSIHWIYGSGFPKSLNVSKAIDKSAGAERLPTGKEPRRPNPRAMSPQGAGARDCDASTRYDNPATESAARWNGWGTALKPAHEPVVMARKPVDGTAASNVERHGTGAINIDACRIGYASAAGAPKLAAAVQAIKARGGTMANSWANSSDLSGANDASTIGRWPANVILGCACEAEHEAGCPVREMDEQSGESKSTNRPRNNTAEAHNRTASMGKSSADWVTHGHADSGGASRFFYCAKASRSERDAGLTGPIVPAHEVCDREEGSAGAAHARAGARTERRNIHPTVKPISLMRYLVRLVTPPGGLVLDPFTGSGTTGCAAVLEGFRFLGFERDAEYAATARARIEHLGGPSEDAPKREAEPSTERQLSLF